MSPRARKSAIILVKSTIAVALLGWVFSRVHWRSYAEDAATGGTWTVLRQERRGAAEMLLVRSGRLGGPEQWRPAAAFRPVPGGGVVREGFLASLVRINVPLAVLGSLGFGVSLLICAGRWWWLLRIQDIRISGWEAVRLTFLGQFFNAVVPGTVGGDLVKAYYGAKHTPRKAAVLLSVLVDRGVGMAGLALMATAMLAVVLAGGLERFEKVRSAAVTVAVLLPVTCLGAALLLSRRLRELLGIEKLLRRLPGWRHLESAVEAAAVYRRRLGAVAWAVPMTFASHVAFVGFIAVVGMALSVPTAWYNYYLYGPLIYTIGAVPVTPGGVGLVETLFVDYFRSPTCTPSTILVLAMLARLVPVLWGIPGAVVAVTGARPHLQQIRREMGVEPDAGPRAGVAGDGPPPQAK